jgi:hypothetical protein
MDIYFSHPEHRDALLRENEDLRTATSQSQNVVLELTLDARVRYISDHWEDIVGYVSELHDRWLRRHNSPTVERTPS